MAPDIGIRTVFDQVARDYDEVRPGYPVELIEDVVALARLPHKGRILEVGCGTGQATLPFARRGYSMLCLDIGESLCVLAAKNCQSFSHVKIENISFENWEEEPRSFDLVLSATAWHWVVPEIGYPKAARALREAGALAILKNMHPEPYSGFFSAVQAVYRRIVPEWAAPSSGPSVDEQISATIEEIGRSGVFNEVVARRYSWSKRFTGEQYLRLLNTFSGHRNLDESRRADLFSKIGDLIDQEFGGVVERPYLSVLYLAQKKGGASNQAHAADA